MDGTVDTLQINVKVNSGNTKSELKSIESEFTKLGGILKNTIKTNNAVTSSFGGMTSKIRRFTAFISVATTHMANWFNESNDYIEAVNLFSVTMGKGADAAKEYADTLQNLMGIDIKEWMNYQGSFNQMLNGFGLENEAANQMSQNLTQISYDLSSLWNTDVETAFQKVQSGMSGQVKGLKVWGINLSVAQLKETALAHGIELSTSKMTESQKAILRYVTIMEKTTNVQGDLARTIITPANAMRILSAQTTQLKRALGNIVSVLVTQFIPYIQLAVKWLTELANRMATFFGFELPEIDYSGLDLSSGYIDDLDDGLSDATDSAKKLKKTLLGFDEINKLSDPTSSDTTSQLGGGLPSDLGIDLSQYDYDFTKNIKLPDFDSVKEKLKDILWYVGAIAGGLLAWKIGSALGASLGVLIGLFMSVVGAVLLVKGSIDALNNGVNLKNFTEMFAGAALLIGGLALAFGAVAAAIGAIVSGIALAVVGIIDAVKNGLNTLNGIMIAGGTTLIGAGIGSFFGPLGKLVGAAIGLVVGLLIDLGIYISQHWEETKALFSNFGKWVYSTFIEPIVNFFTPIFTFINNVLIQPVWNVIKTLCSAIAEWAKAVWSNIVEIASGIWEAIKAVASKIGEIVKTVWLIIKAVVGYVWDKIKDVLKKIKDLLSPLARWVYDKILKPAYDFVVKVANWVSDKISKLINSVKNVAITVANGVSNILKKALNGIFGIAEDVINFFIGGLNKVVDIVNNIPGVSISRVAELSIPKFDTYATGGFPDKGSLFVANELGPELVGNIGNKPAVANNDQIVEAVSTGVYRAVRDAMSESGDGGNSPINIVVTLDGEPIYRDTVKRHNNEVKFKGRSPLNV